MPLTTSNPRPTHFLCIPLASAIKKTQLASSLAAFQADVTNPNSFNIPKSAIRPLGTLHLTLGVMTFRREDEGKQLERAVQLLKNLELRDMLLAEIQLIRSRMEGKKELMTAFPGQASNKVEAGIETETTRLLTVSLRGLRSFQAAKEARVLYAPPIDPFGALHGFCQRLQGVFKSEGFIVDDGKPLTLHATVVNTVYVKGSDRGTKGKDRNDRRGRKERLSIDARDIINQYQDYVWVEEMPVEKVQICKMGAKETEDGEIQYEAVAEAFF